MIAKRGRASYTGERSSGSVDAGAMAVAVIVEADPPGVGRHEEEGTS